MKSTNEERTENYLKKFNKKKFYNYLIKSNAPTIIDVGANTGQSIEEFKKIFKNPTIHAFEPQEDCYKILKKKFKKYKKIKINPNALSDSSKFKKFYYHTFESRNKSELSGFYKLNKLSKDSINLKNKNYKKKYVKNINYYFKLKTIKLDDYIKKNKINKIDILKIDTQGHENKVLLGAKKNLKNIKLIRLELMFYDLYEKKLSFFEIEKILRDYKFELYDILHISKNPENFRTDWVDAVYINNSSTQY